MSSLMMVVMVLDQNLILMTVLLHPLQMAISSMKVDGLVRRLAKQETTDSLL